MMMFALTNMFDSMQYLLIDAAANTITTGLCSAVIGFVNSKVS
jgi:hypothetical protein